MNILLDLIILVIAGVTIFLAAKRGFIKTLVTAASSLIALLVVICFTGLLSGALAETPLADFVHSGTESFIGGLIEDEDGSKALIEDKNGTLYTVLDTVGVDLDEFSDWADDNLGDAEETFREKLVAYIADPVTMLVMKAISMLLLFVGTLLLLKLGAGLLTKLVEMLPFVKQANTLLGIVLGVVLALVRVFIFCAFAGILIKTASLTGIGFLSSIDTDKTVLFRLFDAIQILQFLF